jgi:hypothetical protein
MFGRLPPFIHVAARTVARLRKCAQREWITLQRDPLHQRIAIITLSSVMALTFGLTLHAMNSATERLGAHEVVYVAVREIAPGDVLDSRSFATRHLPALAVAPSTLHSLPSSPVARQHIAVGDVLNTTNVRSAHVHVPRGWQLVMVVPALPMPNLMPGSIVDIVVNAEVVAARVRVDDTIDDGRQVLVAVPPDQAAQVATLAVTGQVSLITN